MKRTTRIGWGIVLAAGLAAPLGLWGPARFSAGDRSWTLGGVSAVFAGEWPSGDATDASSEADEALAEVSDLPDVEHSATRSSASGGSATGQSRIDAQFEVWADELARSEPDPTPAPLVRRRSVGYEATAAAELPAEAAPRRAPFVQPSRRPRHAGGDPFAASERPQRARAIERATYVESAEGPRAFVPDEEPRDDRAEPRPLPGERSRTAAHNGAETAGAAAQGAPQLTVTWHAPREMSLGQQVACRLVVANLGTATAAGVQLAVELPEHARFDGGEPEPAEVEAGQFLWQWEELAAGETREVSLFLTPTAASAIEPRTAVSFQQAAGQAIEILEPELAVRVTGPSQAAVAERAVFTFEVTNTGRGAAADVAVHVRLASAWQHPGGEQLRYGLGTLGPGERRSVDVALSSPEPGSWPLEAAATSGERVLARADWSCEVARPAIALALSGPGRRFVGRPATYVVEVFNPGPAGVDNVEVSQVLPDGFRFVQANAGGTYSGRERSVHWYVGHLAAEQTAKLGLELIPESPGEGELSATAQFDGGAAVTAATTTRVEGLAALALEIHDADDPIEVAGRTWYEIELTNRGSAPARGVEVAARVSAEVRAVEATGPATGEVDGGRVQFAPLDELAPGESVSYRVEVVCQESGRAHFQAFARSADDEEPLVEDEFTQVYADSVDAN